MFQLTSKHRNTIMGVSAVLILVHHYFTNILDKPYKFGAIGVDFFMFAMGLGLYFSLYNGEKEKSFFKSIPSFYMRRFKKIFPPFAAFLVFWGMWMYSKGGFTVKSFILNLSFTGYWTLSYNQYFNWFVSGILLFYIIAPFFYLLIKKSKYNFFSTISLFVIVSILTYLFRKDENGQITRTLIMIVRLIPLAFGMLFGAYCKESPSKTKKYVSISFFAVLFIIGSVLYLMNNIYWNDSGFTYGMPWYSFGLMTPFFCVIISIISEAISKITRWVSYFWSFFGKMSFEIYLTHVFVIEYILLNLHKKNKLWFSEPMNFIAAFFVSVLSAYILHCFSEKITKTKLSKKSLNN